MIAHAPYKHFSAASRAVASNHWLGKLALCCAMPAACRKQNASLGRRGTSGKGVFDSFIFLFDKLIRVDRPQISKRYLRGPQRKLSRPGETLRRFRSARLWFLLSPLLSLVVWTHVVASCLLFSVPYLVNTIDAPNQLQSESRNRLQNGSEMSPKPDPPKGAKVSPKGTCPQGWHTFPRESHAALLMMFDPRILDHSR